MRKIAVLKMNAFIDSPKLIVNGFGAWQGTLGEAFRLNRDRMASHLAFLCTSWDVDTGSSPLARGLPRHHQLGHPNHGIIPARAGFTPRGAGARRPRTDHPRSRGVYSCWSCGAVCVAGIIPARAGFTRSRVICPDMTGDHPRSRGVYRHGDGRTPSRPGSSPLARGLRAWRGCRTWNTPDHPRSRGVY
mgnify:CR=1 FL=1